MKLFCLLVPIWVACCSQVAADDTDPHKVLDEARTLAGQGKYEEALQKHLLYHENSRDYPGHGGVRLSFALSYWMELGKKYPKAKEALIGIRDRDAKAVAGGQSTFNMFMDVAAINRVLDEKEKTVELFKTLHDKNPRQAEESYRIAEEVLVAAKEYKLSSGYIPDALKSFDRIRELRELDKKLDKDVPAPLKKYSEKSFMESTCRLIEVLVGAGRNRDAEKVRERALTVRDDAEMREAMDKAEKRARGKN